MSGDAPCYKCETRYAGCHANCVKYMDFVQKREVENEKIRIEKMVDRLNYNSRSHFPTRTIRQKNDKNRGNKR